MILFIRTNGQGLYEAVASRPLSGKAWMTPDGGLPLDKLVLELRTQGCSQQEINDAVHSAINLKAGLKAAQRDAAYDFFARLVGCGCLAATSVLVVTLGTGVYFGVARFMGWT